jgi:hypothetical protein
MVTILGLVSSRKALSRSGSVSAAAVLLAPAMNIVI